MTTVTVIRVLLIILSISMVGFDFYHYAKKNLTDGTTICWVIFSLALLVAGIHPFIWSYKGMIDDHIYVLMAVISIFLISGTFAITVMVSRLRMRNQELAILVSLLEQENEIIIEHIAKLEESVKDL